MHRASIHRRRRGDRRGTTAVETAFILPIFLLFVMGLIELAHAQLVKHVVHGACRQAARIGTTEGKTTAQVRARALQVLETIVPEEKIQIFVKDASVYDANGTPPTSGSDLESLADIELADAAPRQLFLVRARVEYADIALIPNIPYLGAFLDGLVLEGQSFMRHE